MAATLTSTIDSLDPEEMVVCPFDPVHRLRRKRLQYHIMKCSLVGCHARVTVNRVTVNRVRLMSIYPYPQLHSLYLTRTHSLALFTSSLYIQNLCLFDGKCV